MDTINILGKNRNDIKHKDSGVYLIECGDNILVIRQKTDHRFKKCKGLFNYRRKTILTVQMILENYEPNKMKSLLKLIDSVNKNKSFMLKYMK